MIDVEKLEQPKQDRISYIGCSDIPVIMNASPYSTAYQLWEFKTKKKVAPDISGAFHVAKGVRLEPIIREQFEKAVDRKYVDGNFYKHPVHSFIAGRDDGYCEADKSCLEIKTMSRENHNNVALGIIPEYYQLQCHFEMLLNGAILCHFISGYEDPKTKELHINECTILRDDKVIAVLEAAAVNFWNNHVLADVPPALTDADTNLIIDKDFSMLANSYKLLKEDIEKAEKNLEDIKAKLLGFCSDRPRNVGSGLSIVKYMTKGTVDNQKVYKQYNIDDKTLDSFRKPAKESVRITVNADT